MNKLWKWIDKKDYSEEVKERIFLFLNILLYGILGLLAWVIIRKFTLSTLDWAICFVGYPAFFIGYLGGFLFLCRR